MPQDESEGDFVIYEVGPAGPTYYGVDMKPLGSMVSDKRKPRIWEYPWPYNHDGSTAFDYWDIVEMKRKTGEFLW